MIWSDKLDGKYDITVERIAEGLGKLRLSEGDTVIRETEVPLMYDAIFGPDHSDVMDWQNWAIDIVDNQL